MPKCRLRNDVRFSRAQIAALINLLAEHFQYDDAAGVAPNKFLMQCYDKLCWRVQQNQERDYVVRELQAQSKAQAERERLGCASIGGNLDKASSSLRILQRRPKLGRKERGFYA